MFTGAQTFRVGQVSNKPLPKSMAPSATNVASKTAARLPTQGLERSHHRRWIKDRIFPQQILPLEWGLRIYRRFEARSRRNYKTSHRRLNPYTFRTLRRHVMDIHSPLDIPLSRPIQGVSDLYTPGTGIFEPPRSIPRVTGKSMSTRRFTSM